MRQRNVHATQPKRPLPPISRVLRSHAAAQATYDRLSRWYDLVEAPFERETRQIGLNMLGAREGEQILEIGCGTGYGVAALARAAGRSGRVVGLDLSARMLAVTRARVQRAGLAEHIELVQGDAVRLPFPTAKYDAVFMSFVLELFDTPEIPLVLGECARVLRRGGRIVVVALAMPERDSAMLQLYLWAHRRFPTLVDCRPIHIREAVEAAGFVVTAAVARHIWGLPVMILSATTT